MEISLDALLGAQRDLADRLAQGLSGFLLNVQTPQLPPLPHKLIPFDIELPPVPFVGSGRVDLPAAAVASLVEIGDRLGQAHSGLGASIGGAVQQLPLPFLGETSRRRMWGEAPPAPAAVDEGLAAGRGFGDRDSLEAAAAAAAAATGSAAATCGSGVEGADDSDEEDDDPGLEIGTLGRYKRPKGRVNVSATYNTRHQTVDCSAVARGEIWRFESSLGGSTYGSNSRPPFLTEERNDNASTRREADGRLLFKALLWRQCCGRPVRTRDGRLLQVIPHCERRERRGCCGHHDSVETGKGLTNARDFLNPSPNPKVFNVMGKQHLLQDFDLLLIQPQRKIKTS